MKDKKEFSFDTIDNFDQHIDISIPGYQNLIEHIVNISTYFVKEDSIIYDLGCSTGKLMKLLKDKNDNLTPPASFIGIDKSKNLIEQFKREDNIYLENEELKEFKFQSCSMATSIFTLQFLDHNLRLDLLKRVRRSLVEGGALIVAEKNYIDNGFIQDIYNFTYYDFKRENFSHEEILEKQKDLRHIMQPNSIEQNEQIFKYAGFEKVFPFWQSLQFKAWILIK